MGGSFLAWQIWKLPCFLKTHLHKVVELFVRCSVCGLAGERGGISHLEINLSKNAKNFRSLSLDFSKNGPEM